MGLFKKNHALVASARGITLKERKENPEKQRPPEFWQQRAWDLYRTQGVLHYPVDFIGHALSRLRLVPARESDKDGELVPQDADSSDAQLPNELLHDLARGTRTSGYEGHAALMRALGIHLTLVGESFLIGREEDGKNRYEIRSISEILKNGTDWQIRERPGTTPIDLPSNAQVIRVWIPDAEYQDAPDSPIHPLLELFEELQTLSDALSAIDRSRIPAGILKVPEELDFPTKGKDQEGFDTFVDDLIDHLSQPITNRKAAESLVPFAIQGKGEHLRDLDLLQMNRESVETDIQRMELLFRRIEMGLPLPPEVLTGKAELNHWTGWVISEDVWKAIQPIAVLILSALTHAYLRPQLQSAGMSEEEAEKWWVWFDPTELLVRPDRTQIATDGYDRGLVSATAWRRAAGFSEEDAPSEEDVQRVIDIAAAKRRKDIGATTVDERSAPSSSPPPPPTGEPGPPQIRAVTASVDPFEELSNRLSDIDNELMMRLALGAEEAVDQAVYRLGAALRNKLSAQQRSQLSGVDNLELAAALGPAQVRKLGLNDRQFIRESLERFVKKAEKWAKLAEQTAEASIRNTVGDIEEAEFQTLMRRKHQEFAVSEFWDGLTSQAMEIVYKPARQEIFVG